MYIKYYVFLGVASRSLFYEYHLNSYRLLGTLCDYLSYFVVIRTVSLPDYDGLH